MALRTALALSLLVGLALSPSGSGAEKMTGLTGRIIFVARDGSYVTNAFSDIDFGKRFASGMIPVLTGDRETQIDGREVKTVTVNSRLTAAEVSDWPSRFPPGQIPRIHAAFVARAGAKTTNQIYATYWVTFLAAHQQKKEIGWWQVKLIALD